MRINNETGEIIETDESSENYQLAKRDVNDLAVFEPWLDAKEKLLAAKEQFEMIDYQFRKALEELFDKYQIRSLSNDYFQAVWRNGYSRKTWDSKKLEQFIRESEKDPDEFRSEKWVDGGLTIKYKE